MYFLFNSLPIADVSYGGYTFFYMVLWFIFGITLFLSVIYFIRGIKHKRHGDVYATGEIVVNSTLLFFNIALLVVSIIGMFVENNALLFVLAIVYASVIVVLFIASIIIIIKRYRIYGRDLGVDENKGFLAFSLVEIILECFFWLLILN